MGKPGYVAVAFRTPTGDWEFNGHALLLHETIRTFSLHLPESPPDPARYSYERLQLIETTPYPELGVPLKGGHVAFHVAFSVERGTLKLDLRTDKGEFWANGEYPFHIWGSNKALQETSLPCGLGRPEGRR